MSLSAEKQANRNPIDTSLISFVKLLKLIIHTGHKTHTDFLGCTQGEESGGGKGQAAFGSCVVFPTERSKHNQLQSIFRARLRIPFSGIALRGKEKGILQHFMTKYKNSNTTPKNMCLTLQTQQLCHVI